MSFIEAVYDWANRAFEGDVIWSSQAAPRPALPYAMLHRFSSREVGIGYRENEALALDTDEQVQQLRRSTIQVEAYSVPVDDIATPEAMETLEGALMTLQTEPTIRLFRIAQIAFLSHEVILRLDEFDGDRWERRALCDVHFLHYETTAAESIGRIDTAVPTINLNE